MRISDWSSDVCSSDLNRARAEEMAERLTDLQASIAVVDDLETAVHAADTVSCATLSREPLVRGEWLRPGMHVDLVGGFTPEMREADDATLDRAEVWVDTREGALKEAGDLVQQIGRAHV